MKIDLLIEHGMIVTMDTKNTIFMDGSVAVASDRIVAIGQSQELRHNYEADRTISARGKTVLPGLVNLHTHIAAPVFRAYIEDKPNALYGIAFPVEELLSADDIYVLSLLGCLEVLRFGSTCINDIYHHSLATARAVEAAGIRAVLAHKVFDIRLAEIGKGVYRHIPEEGEARLAVNVQLVDQWHGQANGRIRCRIGTHAADTCSPALLKKARRLATGYGVGLHIHTAQSSIEIAHIQRSFDQPGSVEFLHDLGFLGPDVIAVHCTYVTDQDIDILAETGTKYAACPARFLRRGKLLPITKMLAAGVNTGIGTDWIRMDPWEAMRAAISMTELQRQGTGGPILTPMETLQLATMDSARALALDSEIGSLEVGKKADLILIDMQQPHLTPVYKDSLLTELAYHVNGGDVDTVIIDGNIVVKGRKHQTLDEQSILREAQRVCDYVRQRAADRLGL